MTESSNSADGPRFNQELIPGGSWSDLLDAGSVLRITDIAGHQGVDFLCYNRHNLEERYNAPNTIKAAENIYLSSGSILYSDRANPLMIIQEDTCGQHDTIGGCCSAPSNEMLYGVSGVTGCRENFLKELENYGRGSLDIVPNINFFCSVPVFDQGTMSPGVFSESRSSAGDYVELKAVMPVLVIVSNCPQVHNPCNAGKPTAIRLTVFQ